MSRDPWRGDEHPEEWPEDKAGPEYKMHRDHEGPGPTPGPRRFGLIMVSEKALDLILDLENAHYRLAVAEACNREEVENAYAALNQRRKELYAYVATLEFNLRIPRPIAKRFD